MFQAHPSAYRLDIVTNAPAIWLALKNDETPPDAAVLEVPSRLLVWRQDTTPMFRALASEEAMMWDEAAENPVRVLCEMLATYDDPDGAAARGATYLHGWITAGLLSAVSRRLTMTKTTASCWIVAAVVILAIPFPAVTQPEFMRGDRMPYDAFDRLPGTDLEIGGGTIQVAFAPARSRCPGKRCWTGSGFRRKRYRPITAGFRCIR